MTRMSEFLAQLFYVVQVTAEPINQQSNIVAALYWTLVTLCTYCFARYSYALAGQHPSLQPIMVTSVILALLILLLDIDYWHYRRSVSALEMLILPATVALAVPLYRQLRVIRRYGWRVLVPIFCGGVVAPATAWFSVYLLGANESLQMTMLVKSITTPLAMGTATSIGGIGELAAIIVIITGMVIALVGPWLFDRLSIVNESARGVALGTVGHVIGTSAAFIRSDLCGAMATLGLCLNGVTTALLLPLLFA